MGKFILKTNDKGARFNLLATNGQVIAVSQQYKTVEACQNGIKSVMENAPEAAIEDQTVEGFEELACPKFEIYLDKAGEYRFRLKALNGQIVATSEGYKAKDSCLNGVESVVKNAFNATTETVGEMTQ